jgi:2-polyprenyl-3-methyl-5-hydroxy-6-metoxy-1,4-benzoquinol methylase
MRELADRIVEHYERHAHAWDADRCTSVWNDKPWHDRFIAALPKGASVLDLGCGSGAPVAQNMVEHGLHVTGVDSAIRSITRASARMNIETCLAASDLRSSLMWLKTGGQEVAARSGLPGAPEPDEAGF